jgi:hypothetical protein
LRQGPDRAVTRPIMLSGLCWHPAQFNHHRHHVYPWRRYKYVNGSSHAETLRRILRTCPGQRPVEIFSKRETEEGGAGAASSPSSSSGARHGDCPVGPPLPLPSLEAELEGLVEGLASELQAALESFPFFPPGPGGGGGGQGGGVGGDGGIFGGFPRRHEGAGAAGDDSYGQGPYPGRPQPQPGRRRPPPPAGVEEV